MPKQEEVTMAFHLVPFQNNEVPIVVSVPHCGVAFPGELISEFVPSSINAPDDTDWFVHQLYDFVPSLGITMIYAEYSRWVVDLNRDPQSKPLYSDGRIITGLCPTTDFLGQPIYLDKRAQVSVDEMNRRVESYYQPYHAKLQEILQEKRNKFGKVLLWDCHSIRQSVPTIHPERFPDLILGDADGTSASAGLIETTLSILDHSKYSVSHNHPFKGGYITRNFGKPIENQHALQLEMAKVNYMDDTEMKYDRTRADEMRVVLKRVFESLIEHLN